MPLGSLSLPTQLLAPASKSWPRLSIVAGRCSSRRCAWFERLDRPVDMAAGIRRDKTAFRIDEQGSSPTNQVEN